MKKTRRLLCMLLVVVMLLGAIPAHAATPMTAAASLIALPLSGKLFTALPVSDSISKALPVEEIESTYSTEAKSAPTSAPVEQTTSATAPADRLPDGTTGATANIIGTTDRPNRVMADYPYDSYRVLHHNDKQLFMVGCVKPTKIDIMFYSNEMAPSDLAGKIIPGGYLVDVYRDTKFLCQYDTRDGNDLVIPCAPGANPAQARAAKAPAKGRTAFNDVKPGDWYYEAVTACAEGNILKGILDKDPNGNFNPNAMLDGTEADFTWKRLKGQATEELSFVLSGKNQIKYGAIGAILNVISKEQETKLAQEMAAAGHDLYSRENQSNDAKAIRKLAEWRYKNALDHYATGVSYENYEKYYARAYDLGLIRTPGSPEVIDLNAGLTRAEYCYLLWRAGLTSFGCNAPKK